MAIEINQANAASKPFFQTRFWDQVYRDSAFLKTLKAKKRMQRGGTRAQFPIDYRELGTSDARGPREQVSYASRDTYTGVTTEWSVYTGHIFLDFDERYENDGDQKIINLMTRKTTTLAEDMNNRMGKDVYTKNPNGKGFNPLDDLISAAAFGGVDEAFYRAVTATVATLGWYGDSANDLARYMNGSLFGSAMADILLMSPQLKTKMEGQWNKQARIELTADADLIALGIKSWTFMGATVIADQFMAATQALQRTMYGFESKSIECYESPRTTTGSWKDAEPMGYPGALIRVAQWVGQLSIYRRRTAFKLSGIQNVGAV